MPEISEDGKTVTVKIKEGVKFSPPVNREVDVQGRQVRDRARVLQHRQRTATRAPTSATSRARPRPAQADKEISGIETPDNHTIVFKLTKGTGAALAGALAMPISAPVPEEYAEKFDKKNPSTYGAEARGRHRPVHGQERRRRQGDRLRGRQEHQARPQPELASGRRLPPGVPGRDRDPRRATTTRPSPRGGS